MSTTDGSFTYPAEFIDRAKEAFPNERGLHEMLDTNSTRVGGFLDIKCRGNAEGTQQHAAANELFTEWCRLMKAAGLRDSED